MQTRPLPRANNSRLIIIFAACLSLTISWLYISETHVLSPDSLLYIFTAQTFIDHGLQAAIEAYPWPQLPLLITGIQQITGLSLVLSKQVLIAGLYAALNCAFMQLVRDLGRLEDRTLSKTFSNEKDDKVLILSHQSQTSGPP